MKRLITLLSALFVNLSIAQVTMYEQEPNNTPLNGNTFKGPMVILGSMQDQDQDMFVWEVSDVDTGYLWDIELDGIPESLTKADFMHLTFTEDGSGVTKVDKLFSISNHNGLTSVKKSGLVFSPGTYYIGLSYAGDNEDKASSPLLGDKLLTGLGDEYVKDNQEIDKIKVTKQVSYQLKINKNNNLYSLSTNNNSKENPTQLRNNRLTGLYFEKETMWLVIKISEKESQKSWKITGNSAIGNPLNLNFYDSSGIKQTSTQSDNYGHFLLTDLKLPVGTYLLELMGQENAVTSIEMRDIGESIEGSESEPNDYYGSANQFTIGKTLSGQMGKANEFDFYKFDVSEDLAQNQLEINLKNLEETNLELCLYIGNKVRLQCKSKKGNIDLPQLVLAEGTYGLSVGRGTINTQYTLDIVNKGKIKSINEAEPNDVHALATAMNSKRIIKGAILGNEIDFFKFDVGEEEQMWTIQAIGESITNLSLYNSAGKSVQEQRFPKGRKRVRLSNLHLMPGTHFIRVYGVDSKYILRAFPTGPVDHALEVEPNDNNRQSIRLNFNQIKKGLLQNFSDIDYYRFHLNNEQGVHLTIRPPADGDIQYHLSWKGTHIGKKLSKKGELLEYKGLLPAGDYDLQLNAYKSASDDLYQVDLKLHDAATCLVDCEPNDNAYQSNLIKAPMKLIGETGSHSDADWYKLPAFAIETLVTFQNNKANKDFSTRAYIDYDKNIKASFDREKKQTSFLIPANEDSYYNLGYTDKTYDFTVLIDNKEIETPKTYKDLKIHIDDMPAIVKAYSPEAQNLKSHLVIENTGISVQSFNITNKSNDYRWNIELENDFNQLQAGEVIKIPFTVRIPANTIRNKIVRLHFILKDKEALLAKTWQDVKSKVDAPLFNPSTYWSINDELLGGINVAATAMGGQRTKQDLAFNVNAIGSSFDALFDGYTAEGLGMQYRGGRKSEQDFITIELAGNNPIEVNGIILNPLSRMHPNLYLKNFDLHLSIDGIEYQSVLKGQLKSISVDQSFVLDEIVKARFARLYFLSSYADREKSGTGLGEWKVVANPLQVISNEEGFNIADPKFGGHIAWSIPESSNRWDVNILTEKNEKSHARSTNNEDWQWVVGFHNQRAAKITKIQLKQPQVDISSKFSYELLKKVKVFVSNTSNVGPWELIAEKDLPSVGKTVDVILDKPIWARYVKFSAGNVKNRNTAYFPETIRVFEQKVDENYQSILGEWGELSENAIFEKLNPTQYTTQLDDKNNNSKTSAIDLSQSKKASGQVQLEFADKPDWYKYIPKPGENTLNIHLSGKQSIETVITLEDKLGNQIPLIKNKSKTNDISYKVPVIANQEYYVKVEEPPRSVIFSWDTSGSTNAYQTMIYNAISSYSNDVVAGRDSVNFLPFGGTLLLEDWYGNRHHLKTILNNYNRLDNSSAAETALHSATKALQNRQGSKSIIVITDAITNKYVEMWKNLRKTQPRIFTLGIITNGFGGNPTRQIDLMQSWSRVNNGDFQKVNTVAEVEHAFDRIATKLRQPANYTVNMSSEFIKEPGPGTLIISQDNSKQSSAVELILDASGSMLKRLDGKRRINIAKEVLINAVTEIIPESTPLALRVFGDKQANACRTDLAIQLNPLDRNKAKDVISKINAKNLAKTPIADSLAKVATDLKSHKGRKIVILVTDGEETCDGNPEEVIAQLVEQGLDIRLNIVGFAIDDEDLKTEFNQWSIQGGGKYFDSNDPESLKASISNALKTPFSVYSLSGELIKEGVINAEPMVLPAGKYTIKVYGNEITTYENYYIKGDSEQVIELE